MSKVMCKVGMQMTDGGVIVSVDDVVGMLRGNAKVFDGEVKEMLRSGDKQMAMVLHIYIGALRDVAEWFALSAVDEKKAVEAERGGGVFEMPERVLFGCAGELK